MNSTHPFKVLKYCPRCGSSEFETSGSRSLKCRKCGFHFFINSSAAVAALVTDQSGKIMMVKRGVEPGYGKLDLPGGFVDPGETAENAVIRELWEELGLKVKKLVYFGSATNEYVYSGYSVFTLDLAFKIEAESLKALKAMDDILEFRFYGKDEIDFEQVPAPSIKKFVKDFFKNE